MGLPPYLHEASGGTRIDLYVQPGAAREGLAGIYDGSLKLRLRAPAQDGKANRAVLDFFSELLDLPKQRVAMTSGQGSRRKTVLISGITPTEVAQSLSSIITTQ